MLKAQKKAAHEAYPWLSFSYLCSIPSNIKSPKNPAKPRLLSLILKAAQLRRLVGCNAGVHNLLDVPVHHFVQLIQRQVNPVVRHAALGEIISPDFLRAVPCANLAAPCFGFRVMLLLALYVVELRPEQGESLILILEL